MENKNTNNRICAERISIEEDLIYHLRLQKSRSGKSSILIIPDNLETLKNTSCRNKGNTIGEFILKGDSLFFTQQINCPEFKK